VNQFSAPRFLSKSCGISVAVQLRVFVVLVNSMTTYGQKAYIVFEYCHDVYIMFYIMELFTVYQL